MIRVGGKGESLPDPTLGSLAAPVTVQLINSETGVCWQSTYSDSDISQNSVDQFKAQN